MRRKSLIILAVIFALSVILVPQTAIAESDSILYTETTQSSLGAISDVDAYPNTHINTGDMIYDLIKVAASQVGYYRPEGLDTKYGSWYGYPKDAWCAMFISWCANEAGVPNTVIKKFCRCSSEADWFKANNQWAKPAGYLPKAGDIIFFTYRTRIDHVGIVTGVDSGYIYCIEGNNGDSVNITRHSIDSAIITGYGTPCYSGETADEYETVNVYRLYNPNSGEHFYTVSITEKDRLVGYGWRYEGVGWQAPKTSETPVYRLYNPNAGDHHYTTSTSERDSLVKAGWRYESVGWYSASSGVSVYRLYNPNAKSGAHHYTTSVSEKDMLIKAGWKYEGICWHSK